MKKQKTNKVKTVVYLIHFILIDIWARNGVLHIFWGVGGNQGGCFLFLLFWGTPKDMDLRNAYMYSLPRHLTV